MPFNDAMETMLPTTSEGTAPHVTSNYGPRAGGEHGGVDFNYHGGQAGVNLTHPDVHSPVRGRVTFVGGQYGTVAIRDANGNNHQVLHLNTTNVTEGQEIEAGTVIGTMGGRGPNGANQYQRHVHYQMTTQQGQRINPQEWWDNQQNQPDTTQQNNGQ